MVPVYDYLRPDSSLTEAAKLLRTAVRGEQKYGVMGLSVLDEKGNLVGMLSMIDILKAVYPFYMYMMNLGEFTWDGMIVSLAKQARNKKVREHMTSPDITVHEDDPLMECVDRILKNRVRRLPVIDKSGKVVGMIYMRDVFYTVTKAMIEEDH